MKTIDGLFAKLRAKGCKIEPCGSRVTCNPAPTDTDQDYLVEVPSQRDCVSWVEDTLSGAAFRLEGTQLYQEASGFQSWRREDVNLIVTASADFARRHRSATHVCTRLNIMNKDARIALFQAVLYGNIHVEKKTSSRSTAHVLHSCNEERCFVCDGGLAMCTVCGGGEGAMPTDCPGAKIAAPILDQIYRGEFDFVGGQWINKQPLLNLAKMPVGCDWIVAYTNGGMTIHAQVGPMKERFGATPQEALDLAIEQWKSQFVASPNDLTELL